MKAKIVNLAYTLQVNDFPLLEETLFYFDNSY